MRKFQKMFGVRTETLQSRSNVLGSWAGRKDTPFGFRWPEEFVYALSILQSNDKRTSDRINF